MKWQILYLIVVLVSLSSIISPHLETATSRSGAGQVIDLAPSSDRAVAPNGWETSWSDIVRAYGALSERGTGGRRTARRPRKADRPQNPRADRKATPSAAPPPAQGDSTSGDEGASPPAEQEARIPLRLVLKPGVILTKRGLQLRPMIARLGDDGPAYQALWADRDAFRAAIQPFLDRSCPLCEGESGFRCIGSGQRSVIPPGRKDRVWFRVQKVRCRDCEAITRILPTFCLPFKSHHAQTIQNALENCWRRNNSYRDTTGILNQSRPPDGKYRGHTLPYEWTIWLGGLTIHLPQFLVWLGLQVPQHSVLDEYFMAQDNGTDNHRIFAVTLQDPESTAIWHILRVDRNDTAAFKQALQQLKAVGVQLRAVTSDGWPAILRAVREELADTIHLLCYFHAKKNVFETLDKYRQAKKLPEDAPELTMWQRAFFEVLDAPSPQRYRARLRKLTKRVAHEPILLARCKSLQKKSHYNTWRMRSPGLAATSSLVELSFKQLTRKAESMYSFRRSKCDAAQKSLIVWALVRNFVPYLPGAKHEGQSPAQLAGVDLDGLPWLQYINLKLSEVP